MLVFPVDPNAHPKFSDTWGAARSGGRTHEGTDIFAPEGTAVFAVEDGKISAGTSKLGGLYVNLDTDDGTRWYYAHLSDVDGSEWPRKVKAGEVIGYVGRTGNAANTLPHLHFGKYLSGSGAVNPFDDLSEVAPPGALAGASAPSPSTTSSRTKSSSTSSSKVIGFVLAVWVLHELAKA